MKFCIQLVTWNGAKYIPYLFKSLREQTFKDWFLFVWDNNSSDDTIDLIKNEVNKLGVQYKIIENKENLGFAGGHNAVFRQMCHTEPRSYRGKLREEFSAVEYVILLNQDMYLEPDCLEKLVNFMDAHPEAAAVSPRVMKWNFDCCHSEAKPKNLEIPRFSQDDICGATNIIDTLGLKVFRNRRVVDWQTGEEWPVAVIPAKLVPERHRGAGIQLNVFGVSGALPMYRRTALEAAAFSNGDFFDSSYHSYKEDVDLAYRLASAGFKSYIMLDTAAYHDRAGAGPKSMDDAAALANKKMQSARVKYYSYKNHLMTLYKNEYWQNFLLDFFWILWYEVKKFVYFLLLDRGVLAGLKDVWKIRKELREKRKWIGEKRKINWRNIREMFNF